MATAIESTLSDFTRFDQFRPTSFDQAGLGSEDQADWLVIPGFSRHPKMGDTLLDESNWDALVKCLETADPEGADHTIHLFGHWATDFEIIVVRPDSAAHLAAAECVCAMADYPVLDEEDHSDREYRQQHADITDGLSSLTVLEADGSETCLDDPMANPDRDQSTDPSDCYLVHQIWTHMWNDGQPWRCLQETGQAGGGGVDRSDCERALEEMGYVYDDSEMTWRGTEN